jgi:hypothetical protein
MAPHNMVIHNPSGISDLCSTVAEMVTPKGSMSTEGQTLKFLFYLIDARYVHPCTVTIDSVLANSKTQNAFLFAVHAMFRHDCPLAVKPASTPRRLVHKTTWRDSLPIGMVLSAVSVLVVARPSSEFPEGLMNFFVCVCVCIYIYI